jgi:NAD+ synthase (glutamine-hydrolysing)
MLSPMRGFARIGAAVPACGVTDFAANTQRTVALLQRAHREGLAVVAFPELGLTSYTARDLLHDQHLLDEAHHALREVAHASRDLAPLALVGAPVRVGGELFNAAVAIQGGEILAVVPKSYLPNYREFEEARWFRPGREVEAGRTIELFGQTVALGTDILLCARDVPDLVVAVEVCEDYWVQLPPSAFAVGAGATVVCNLSASNFTVGKAQLRRLLARAASDRGKCAYLYVAAGPGESSTDLAFDADAFVCENGSEVAHSQRFSRDDQLVSTDIDLELLVRERLVTTTFGDCARHNARSFRRVPFAAPRHITAPLRRRVSPRPFVASDPADLEARCWEIFEIQTRALSTRARAIGQPKLVLGLSGGLDSTQAALVCAGTLDLEARPRTDLVCVTMPGLGTSEATRGNAERLAEALGAQLRTISISEASRHVLALIGHPAATQAETAEELVAAVVADPRLGDVTLENVQARLRTLVLMSIANADGGIVVGTGDLSEKALGWATYAGDHIAMYDVNAGVPKTLIQSVVRWVAEHRADAWTEGDPRSLRDVLAAIVDTPISPELLPTGPDGEIAQRTEATIGRYELHDFFLYHVVRHGARPGRVLDLAQVAFGDEVPLPELKRWFVVFLRRFFSQQFKRSCTADGPKVGQVALSPRGDWRMPSDASVQGWIDAVERYPATAPFGADEAFERR